MNRRQFFFVCFFLIGVYMYAQIQQDALLLYRQKKYTEAITVCRAEIKKTPKNLDSYVVLSWALTAAGQYDEAYRQAARGREISRYDPRLIEIQGEARFYAGKNEEALQLFQEYISYAPNGNHLSEIYFFMGEIYVRMSRYHHADIAFSTAVHLTDNESTWWERLGYAREQAGEYRLALAAYDQALQLNKNLENARRGRERVLKFF